MTTKKLVAVRKKVPKPLSNRTIARGCVRLALVLGLVAIPVRAYQLYSSEASSEFHSWRGQLAVWNNLGCAAERAKQGASLVFDHRGVTNLKDIGCSDQALLAHTQEISNRPMQPEPRLRPTVLRWRNAGVDGAFVFAATCMLATLMLVLRKMSMWVLSGFRGR